MIPNYDVMMCFWISTKFHHLFDFGEAWLHRAVAKGYGTDAAVPGMEPCLWCYACGCICGISYTSFLNIFKYWMYTCIGRCWLFATWFCCYPFKASFLLSLCEAYNALLKGLVLQRNFKSAEDWLKTMQKVQLAPKLGTGSTMQFQLILYNIAYRMRFGVDKKWFGKGESLQGQFLAAFGFKESKKYLKMSNSGCCEGQHNCQASRQHAGWAFVCELRSFCTMPRNEITYTTLLGPLTVKRM